MNVKMKDGSCIMVEDIVFTKENGLIYEKNSSGLIDRIEKYEYVIEEKEKKKRKNSDDEMWVYIRFIEY